jgi:hypothetical protein
MRTLILRAVVALGVLTATVASAQEGCKPAQATNLPAVSALLDSASLVKNLPAPDAAASKEVFVNVTTGPVPKAVIADTTAAKSDAGRLLVQRVVESLRPNAKTLVSTFGLKVLLGEAPTLSVSPPMVCPPKGTFSPR